MPTISAALARDAGASAAEAFSHAVIHHPDEIAEEWDRLEAEGTGSVYQRRPFVSAWIDTLSAAEGAKPLLVTLRRDGRLVLVLPLALRRRTGLTIAEFCGGSHANHNLPLFDPAEAAITPAFLKALLKRLAGDHGIDAFVLRRQPLVWNGDINPLADAAAALPSTVSAQDVRLNGDFEALLRRHRGTAKRKKMRAKERVFEAAGDYRIVWAKSAAECHDMLEVFFRQKSRQFQEKGIRDIFGDPATQAFFHRIVDYHRCEAPVLELAALSAGGEIRAVRGYGLNGKRLSLMMQSFTEDALSRASPGETLLFRSFEKFAERGFQNIDFGVGRERYKDSWTDCEIPLVDGFLGASASGRAFVTLMRLRQEAERSIRSNERLWQTFRSLRRRLRGRRPAKMDGGETAEGGESGEA